MVIDMRIPSEHMSCPQHDTGESPISDNEDYQPNPSPNKSRTKAAAKLKQEQDQTRQGPCTYRSQLKPDDGRSQTLSGWCEIQAGIRRWQQSQAGDKPKKQSGEAKPKQHPGHAKQSGTKRGDNRCHARPSSCLAHSGVASKQESIRNRSQTRPRIVKSATDRNQSQTGSKPEQQTIQAETCITGLRQKTGQAGPSPWPGQANHGSIPSRRATIQKQEPCPVLNKVEAGAKRGDIRSHARPSSSLVHSGVGSRKESIQNRSQTRPRIVKSATDRNQSQTGSKPEQQTVQAETGIAGLRQKPGQAGPSPGPGQANQGSIPSRSQGRSVQRATMQKQEPCPVLNKVEAGAKRGDIRSHARPSSSLVHSGVGSRKESIRNRSQTRPRIVKSATDRNQSQTGSKPEQQTVQAETGIAGLRQKPGQAGPSPLPGQANQGSIPSRSQGRSDQRATMQKQEPCPVLNKVEAGAKRGDSRSHARPSSSLVHSGVGSRKESIQNRSQTRPRIVKSATDRNQSQTGSKPEQQTVQVQTGITGLRQKADQEVPNPGPGQANQGSTSSRSQGRSDQRATMQKQEPCPVLSQVEAGATPGLDKPNRPMKEPGSYRYQARPSTTWVSQFLDGCKSGQ